MTTAISMAFIFVYVSSLAWIGKRSGTLRMRSAKRTDFRVKVMNEIILGIQVIKMYAWENSFAKMVDRIRKCVQLNLKLKLHELNFQYLLPVSEKRCPLFGQSHTFKRSFIQCRSYQKSHCSLLSSYMFRWAMRLPQARYLQLLRISTLWDCQCCCFGHYPLRLRKYKIPIDLRCNQNFSKTFQCRSFHFVKTIARIFTPTGNQILFKWIENGKCNQRR